MWPTIHELWARYRGAFRSALGLTESARRKKVMDDLGHLSRKMKLNAEYVKRIAVDLNMSPTKFAREYAHIVEMNTTICDEMEKIAAAENSVDNSHHLRTINIIIRGTNLVMRDITLEGRKRLVFNREKGLLDRVWPDDEDIVVQHTSEQRRVERDVNRILNGSISE